MFLFDIPSLVGVLCCFFMGEDTKSPRWKSIAEMSLILGACLSLIAIIHMLSQLGDSVLIGQEIVLALLPMLYAGIIVGVCSIFSSTSMTKATNTQASFVQKAYSMALFAIVLVLAGLYNGLVVVFWDTRAFVLLLIFVGIPLANLWYRMSPQQKKEDAIYLVLQELRNYSVVAMAIAFGLSSICTLYYLDDPTAIGPCMAVGLLSQLYGCSVLGVASILDTHREKYTNNTIIIGVIIVILEIVMSITVLFVCA